MKETLQITYREAIRQAMCEEMRRDDSVYLMGEDIGIYGGAFGVSKGMLEEFGEERIRQTPISETAFVGAGIGSAVTGMRPIVELMFSDFSAVCFDQIINQAAKMHFMFAGKVNVPMVIRTAAGGGTGAAAQHSQSLEQLFCHVPGLKVVAPSTPYDAKGLLKAAIRDNNPVIFLEQKLLYNEQGQVPQEDYTVPLGKAHVKRDGKDVSVITYGRMVKLCLQVAEKLAPEGIDVEVLDLRSLSPLDTEAIIATAEKTGRVVVVHEAVQFAGFGGEIVSTVADSVAFGKLKAPIKRVGGAFRPVPYSRELEKQTFPTQDRVEEAIHSTLG